MRKIFLIFFLIIAYLFTRLVNLTLLPIVTDEAIYIRWTQIAEGDAAWRLISLVDGKQPLFIWLAMFPVKFLRDPLLAGRLVSVLAGFGSLVGIYFLSKELTSKKTGLFSAVLYLISPFFLFHDRIALMDSLLVCFMIWGVFLEVLLAKKPRLDLALLLGMVIGVGMLTKSSALFLIYFLPLSLLFFNWKKKEKLLYWTGLASISIVISQLLYAIQRLSPFYHMINLKNQSFIYTFSQIFSFDFLWVWQNFIGNLKGLTGWLLAYITLPLMLLVVFNFFIKEKIKERIFLFSWFALPFLALAFFGKVIYPRFILFMSYPLLILVSFSFEKIKEEIKNLYLLLAVTFLILLYPFYFDYQIIFNPINMPIPHADRFQYVDDWPSGYGIKEVVEFFKKESATKKIFIGTEGTFGLTPYALEIYLEGDENVKIVGYWPISERMEE